MRLDESHCAHARGCASGTAQAGLCKWDWASWAVQVGLCKWDCAVQVGLSRLAPTVGPITRHRITLSVTHALITASDHVAEALRLIDDMVRLLHLLHRLLPQRLVRKHL